MPTLKVYESFAETIEEARKDDENPGQFESMDDLVRGFTTMADGTPMDWPGLTDEEIADCKDFAAGGDTLIYLADVSLTTVGMWIEKIT